MKERWLDIIKDDPCIEGLVGELEIGKHVGATGCVGSVSHLVAGAVGARADRPVLLVVAHLDEADEALEDLAHFEGKTVVVFPALEVMPGETNISLELLADRLSVVSSLMEKDQPDFIIAPVQALMQTVPKKEAVAGMVMELRPGKEMDQEELLNWLGSAGYERVEMIDQAGDFSVRGGLVDIYPPGAGESGVPIRVDFFGDEIDEIAAVDPVSMSTDRKLKSVRLVGASTERIQQEERVTSFWSLLRPETVVVLNERLEIAEQARGYYERLTDDKGIIGPPNVFKGLDGFAVLELNQFDAAGMTDTSRVLPVRALVDFEKDAAKAMGGLSGLMEEGDEHEVVVLAQRPAEKERLGELMAEHASGAAEKLRCEIGYLYRGFIWEPSGEGAKPLAVIPHHELFHRYQTRRRIRQVSTTRVAESFLDIEVGDYVVHSNHGIAKFRGLRLMEKGRDGGEGEEYLTLEFADRALLHVPASQIELVHKYVGGFAGRPPLSKLGGKRWSKQKEEAKEAAKELAAELLRVQAARASMPGVRYPADTAWMKQFEAEFPYQETEDQLAAMVEIKKNMCDPQPMDRLVCGDVGYGKTELAIRAAFKAVESGKQVAVLCPTTVLCQQHERTFRERLADYPIRITALNRFKGAEDMRLSLEGARNGSIDVVIGTHRLLSDDVRFADLGLVIVDEEQKFGVEHKTKLMRYRVTVDVLTLSATPIPRTLHFALLGLRDISSLSTPPADRRAVVTDVISYEEKRIRNAILRELNRDGQCYFVHNRVQSIHQVATDLRALVPEARFVVGHGQMNGRELEEVMLKFVNHEADVLVCTTIIESGIDIPSANTMFIADCDRFGLAELHQLRGRVGRYKHRAYCYLLLPKTRALSEVSSRRLRAIEEFSMLGAGFKIAMRDMEIRGVGNLLGKEQSGHIATVGYEMYCQLLEQATSELKNQTNRQTFETHVELKIAGRLPRRYIPSDKHRMEAYRRISRAPDFESLAEVEASLIDAYGPLPGSASCLIALAEIRLALAHLGVERLVRDGADLVFSTQFVKDLSPLLAQARGTVRLVDTPTQGKAGTIYYRPPASYFEQPDSLFAVLRKLLVPRSSGGEKVGRRAQETPAGAMR